MDISSLSSVVSSSPFEPTAGKLDLNNSGEGFGSMIKDAVESLNSSSNAAEQEITKTVSGESTDMHKTIIALQTADLKMQLGLQVRNKLMGAYEEIMRMQV
jgi:flagellar hook-basal body complex protein FliE